MESKICRKCGEDKLLENFVKNKSTKDGLNNQCKSCKKEYNKNNFIRIKKRLTEYNIKNKERIRETNKIYNLLHKEVIDLYNKEYNSKEENKVKIKKQINKRYQNDILFRLKTIISANIQTAFKRKKYTKNTRTYQILDCSYNTLKLHFESKFESWMNWENQGDPKDGILELNKTWDIDHIIPISTAKTEEELIKLNHYTNLQPLCSYTNRIIKRDRLDYGK